MALLLGAVTAVLLIGVGAAVTAPAPRRFPPSTRLLFSSVIISTVHGVMVVAPGVGLRLASLPQAPPTPFE